MSNKKNVKDFDRYKKEATDWDISQYKRTRATAFMLWIYSLLATIAIVALAVAIYLLLPLKERVPYLIRVDNSTGIAEVLGETDIQNATFTQTEEEALNKYFLTRYVIARESYNPALRYENYDIVAVMSTPVVTSDYLDHVNSGNPNAPVNVLARNGLINIKIKTISFPETSAGAVAHIRFIRTVKNLTNNEESQPEHLLATVNFEYKNAQMDNEARSINPLGFLVTAYQLTDEVVR